jgi:transposase
MPRNPGDLELKNTVRGQVIGLWQSGMNKTHIAIQLDCHVDTVRKWVSRFEEAGYEGLANRHRTGRIRLTNEDADDIIVAASEGAPLTSASSILRDMNVAISAKTVRRRLHEAGRHHQIPAKKEILTEIHKFTRLEFALEYVNQPPEFWDTVVFSDEKSFSSEQDAPVRLWRPPHTRYEPENIAPKARSGRISLMFWGWMCAAFPGHIVRVGPRMNSMDYCNILEDEMLPTVRTIFPEPHMINFVQDNSAEHTAHVVQDWFNQHPEINKIQWPPKSPDLNPIEHLWAKIVQAWEPLQQRNVAVLHQHVVEMWRRQQQTPDLCNALVASMRDRLLEVIEAQGGHTSY